MPFEWDPSWKKSRLLHHHLRTRRGGIKWDLGQTLTGSNFRSHLLVGPRTLHSLLDRKKQVSGGSSGAALTSCQRFSADRGRPVHLKLKWIEWHSMNVLRMVHDKVGWGCTVRLTFCPLRVGYIDRWHGLPEVAACTIQIQVEGRVLTLNLPLKQHQYLNPWQQHLEPPSSRQAVSWSNVAWLQCTGVYNMAQLMAHGTTNKNNGRNICERLKLWRD